MEMVVSFDESVVELHMRKSVVAAKTQLEKSSSLVPSIQTLALYSAVFTVFALIVANNKMKSIK